MSAPAAVEPPERFSFPEEAPFWEAIEQGRFMLATCTQCEARSATARSCVVCGSPAYEWLDARASGTVRSLARFHRAYHKWFEATVPYVVVLVALDDGPELLMGIEGETARGTRIGMRVDVVTRKRGENVILAAVPSGGAEPGEAAGS
jgi:uncharacterized OB-fold protein